jgi:hypothetical protein
MQKKNNRLAWDTASWHLMLRLIIWTIILIPVYYFLYKIYIPKINAFGCFDDCFNYVGGYFLGKGRQLYSQIYFDHMPLMAYLSYLVQRYGNPVNIYAVVLQHRQFLLLFGFIFNVFLCWRFGIIGLGYMILYEFSKFYVFGDRFLAESFIVYPLVYLTGLGLHTLLKKHISQWEIVLAAVCLWFIVFMREPYVPVAVFLFGIIIRPVFFKKISFIAVGVLLVLTAGLFTLFPVRNFVYNIVTDNVQRGLLSDLQPGNFFGMGIAKSFFYPVYLLIAGQWNDFRIQLISLSIALGVSAFVWIKTKKNPWVLGYLFIALGLANLRPTLPGLQYYEAYHEINWYGMFLFSSLYLLYESMRAVRKRYIYFIITGLLLLFVLFSPRSFIYQHVDQQGEFITNYGTYLQISEVIKAITTPQQTLFTNGADEFLYLASARNSSYPFSFYYPRQFKDKYYNAAINMFSRNPPDILYDFCSPNAPVHPYLSAQILSAYAQWYSQGQPTCLYMKKSLVAGLTQDQRAKAQEFLYYMPEK